MIIKWFLFLILSLSFFGCGRIIDVYNENTDHLQAEVIAGVDKLKEVVITMNAAAEQVERAISDKPR